MALLTEFHKWQKKKGFNYKGSQESELKVKLYSIYLSLILGENWNKNKENNLFSHWGPNKSK